MSVTAGAWNLGTKAARRLTSLHKPVVRLWRRRQRLGEHEAFARATAALDREIARVAAGDRPIVVGPWLAEVGYEVLYWVPFVRWFADAFRIEPSRLTVMSRGGMDPLYADLAGTYVDLFDVMSPAELAAGNAQRQSTRERGGQKQSALSPFDEELLALAAKRTGASRVNVLHPSLMFNLFRHAWHGNVPMDLFWNRTRYLRLPPPAAGRVQLPQEYTAVKLYTGPAITRAAATRAALRELVARAAATGPVIAMTTDFGLDEHDDLDLGGIAGVTDARSWMSPRDNLTVQLAIVGRATTFLSTCGGLAWLAPFLGVPTVAVYDSDHLLAPHLLVARQAGKRAGAAEFSTLDLRAVARAGLIAPQHAGLE